MKKFSLMFVLLISSIVLLAACGNSDKVSKEAVDNKEKQVTHQKIYWLKFKKKGN